MKNKNWKLVAGGCSLTGKLKFPCDDTYENQKTKKRITIYSKKESHFKMPSRIDSVLTLLKRGVVVKKQR